MKENVNCLKCKYYMVTWDPRFPRGCKLFEFKGTVMPSIMVYKSTGAQCQNFILRQVHVSEV
ncbi:MAG: hypothetical protein K0S75_99 [Clostridia bacterium]|jgi:hypothetical protein|nr:hypothetical protein [Clostridia bacterium]